MKLIPPYPRTTHLQGSGRPFAKRGLLDRTPLERLKGLNLVVEEKIDGAHTGILFYEGKVKIISRRNFLRGGPTEGPFQLLKTWTACHFPSFQEVLGERYVMFGEWAFAKHTVFYDLLPHYFLEFDVYDREKQIYLTTPARRSLLESLPVVSVPVLAEGTFEDPSKLPQLVTRSLYKSADWKAVLAQSAWEHTPMVEAETDPSDDAEGLYIKWEEDGQVKARHKWVRPSFLATVLDSGSHWRDRPVIENHLADGVDIYSPT